MIIEMRILVTYMCYYNVVCERPNRKNSQDFLAAVFMQCSLTNRHCHCHDLSGLSNFIFSFAGMIIFLRQRQLLHKNDDENLSYFLVFCGDFTPLSIALYLLQFD